LADDAPPAFAPRLPPPRQLNIFAIGWVFRQITPADALTLHYRLADSCRQDSFFHITLSIRHTHRLATPAIELLQRLMPP
jgi:hypothetical protein